MNATKDTTTALEENTRLWNLRTSICQALDLAYDATDGDIIHRVIQARSSQLDHNNIRRNLTKAIDTAIQEVIGK